MMSEPVRGHRNIRSSKSDRSLQVRGKLHRGRNRTRGSQMPRRAQPTAPCSRRTSPLRAGAGRTLQVDARVAPPSSGVAATQASLSNIIFPQNFFNETADDAPRPATWCSRAWARGRCCGSLQRTWAWTTIDAKTETCVSWVGEAKAQSWARRTAGRCSRRTSTREQRCDGSRSRTAAEIAGESRSRTSA